ncbi:MAG: hypothetical protein HY075_04200, partial [Deltaproteobacteria bacterium]|nr:hypothetical protein [Deltaproteobacteria bacterium]
LYPVGFAWLLESVPESRYGAASGAFARAYGLGSLAGPLACAAAAQRFGSSGMFAAIAAAGCATLALGVVRRS